MSGRGKNVNWTTEQDQKILKGEKVAATPVQVASRRYRLKTHYSAEVSRFAKKLLDRLSHMKLLGLCPKSATEKFLESLKKVVEELESTNPKGGE